MHIKTPCFWQTNLKSSVHLHVAFYIFINRNSLHIIAVHEVSRTHKDSHTGVVLESVPVHGWINGEGSRIHHAGAQAADTEAPEPLRRALQPIHCWLQKLNLYPIEALINRGTLKREDTELICVTLTKTALKWGHYFCRPTGLSKMCLH